MADNYWDGILRNRVSRRHALAATGASAAAAAFLAACGGGNEGTSDQASAGKKDLSGLVTDIEDTSKAAKTGGTFKWFNPSEPNHLDGMAQGQAQLNVFNGMVYASLVSNKSGYKQPSSFNEVVPNMAESWEFSPDKTQITFKLRQGVKWQNRNPINGRAFDSSDVVATFKRYGSLPSNNRAANMNEFNPNAPLMSVTAPDANTVVYKLKEPTSYIMQRFANMVTGELGQIYPRETGTTFDPRLDQIGTGGFELVKWEPSIGLTYKRNPDYWDKSEPRIGILEVPIVPQPATALAALKSGQIFTYTVRPDQQVATKKETPALSMYRQLAAGASVGHTLGFGWLPFGSFQKSPFQDIRVRQAMSLAEDRDAVIDTMYNVSSFTKEGLPIDTFLYSSIGYVPGVHLDPRGKDFGADAHWYGPDHEKRAEYLKEAKQLLSAAGHPNGFEYPSHFVNPPTFTNNGYNQEAEIRDAFQQEIGLKPVAKGLDYNIDYLQKFITQQGKFQGTLYRLGATSSPDPVDYYVWRYWSKAGPTSGALFTGEGSDVTAGDKKVDEFIEKAKAETDVKKQTVLLHDLQRHLGKMQYCVSRAGLASGFVLAWPAAANFQVFQGDSRAINNHFYTTWVDETKAPIKKA
ncbi:MAG TPA: ABC transporter substrate-binding protein [Dehalococcoidia bacterium]|nr:ABC transporter substrate-binding protein [Dehalococcoidia bacterium]